MRTRHDQIATWEALEPRLLMNGSLGADVLSQTRYVEVLPAGAVHVTGELASPDCSHMYSFVGPARGWFTLDMASADGDLDPALELYHADGRRILDNDRTDSADSRIRFRIKPGQVYYVKVSGIQNSTGAYQLSLTSDPRDDYGDTPESAGNWRLDAEGAGRRRGNVNYPGDVDLLEVLATRTGVMHLTMEAVDRGMDLAPSLGLADAEGVLMASSGGLGSSSATQLSINVVAGQTYYVLAGGGDAGMGRYQLHIATVEVPGPSPHPTPEPDSDPQPAPVPPPDPSPDPDPDDPDGDPVYAPGDTVVAELRTTAAGLTLVVLGTDGDDVITLSQTPEALQVAWDGQVYSFNEPIGRVEIYGFGGDDVLRTTSCVSVFTVLDGGDGNDALYDAGGAAELRAGAGDNLLVSVGGAASSTIYGGPGFDSYWVSSDDILVNVSDAELAGGNVHRIGEFYQPFTTNPADPRYVSTTIAGQSIDNPLLTAHASGYASYADAPLFVGTPVYYDIDQGDIGDCYYLAVLAGYADTDPNIITQMIAPLGDGTYAVRFYRGGQEVYLRIDADLPVRHGRLVYAGLGEGGSTWVALAEKAYAYFRYDQNSYDSIQGGWMNVVYNEITNSRTALRWLSDMTAVGIYNYLTNQMAAGSTVSLGSVSGGSGPIVGSHAYAVLSTELIDGQRYITVYNPWGVDGRPHDDNPNDGVLQLTIEQAKSAFIAAAVSFA